LVSILIPARNEADSIANTIRSLRAQSYMPFEVILLDDQSTDGTAEIARAAAQGDARVQIIAGQPLLEGWLGKNWACHQLSNEARGRVLVFTDADVQWQPDAFKALVAMMQRTQADLLTVWPTQITVTRGERLVVPLIALAIFGYLPAILVQKTPYASLAAASGEWAVPRLQESGVSIGGRARGGAHLHCRGHQLCTAN
jgi:chlorobactene glucosyltransferase